MSQVPDFVIVVRCQNHMHSQAIKSLGYNHGSELWWKEEFKPACGEAAINKKGVVSPKG